MHSNHINHIVSDFSDSNDPIANADDTQNGTLDNSLDIETEVKLPKTRKKTNKSTEKCDDAELKLDSGKKNNKFVPGKGQKTAFNKLQKIKGMFYIKHENTIAHWHNELTFAVHLFIFQVW